ncbi:MAG: Bug family tripartite tricarboxylate transporter substrate binding protein, partial [Panacagrimonas sp.]
LRRALQAAQALAERGLTERERLGGTAEIPAFSDNDEVLDVPQAECHNLISSTNEDWIIAGMIFADQHVGTMRSLQTLACAGLLWGALAVQAQGWPQKPVRVIVPFPPGGGVDVTARLIGDKLARALGQPVLVENRGGAGGTIAAAAVAKAAPDGYTLLQNSITTHGVGPHLYTKLPYDPVKDFAPVSGLALLPLIMAVNAELPFRNINDVVNQAKAQPVNFASSGNGGAPHMAAELFKSVTGAPLTHVPYKGSGPAVADLVGGRVQIMFDAAPSLIAHIRSGRLRVLGAASAERNRLLPEVPTFGELGYPKVAVSLWYGLLAPAGTPKPVVERLNREALRALTSPDVRDKLQAQGAEPMPGTPEAFASFMQEEMAKWAPVVKQAGVKLD